MHCNSEIRFTITLRCVPLCAPQCGAKCVMSLFFFSFFLQCKLEFQSCISGKSISVKCEGLCPCLPGQELRTAAHKADQAGEYSSSLYGQMERAGVGQGNQILSDFSLFGLFRGNTSNSPAIQFSLCFHSLTATSLPVLILSPPTHTHAYKHTHTAASFLTATGTGDGVSMCHCLSRKWDFGEWMEEFWRRNAIIRKAVEKRMDCYRYGLPLCRAGGGFRR